MENTSRKMFAYSDTLNKVRYVQYTLEILIEYYWIREREALEQL